MQTRVALAASGCTQLLHDADQSPNPLSITTVGLPAPATYRFRVTFRWMGSSGQQLLSAVQTSSTCYQPELRADLLAKTDYHLTRDTDTEVIQHYLSHELRGDERPDLVQVFRNLSEKFDGAYNIVFMNASLVRK